MSDPLTIGLNELVGSPVETLDESSGSAADRRFLVPWDERFTFAASLVKTNHYLMPAARVASIVMQPWTEDLVSEGVISHPQLATADYGVSPCLVTVKYGPDFVAKQWPDEMPRPSIRSGTELRFQLTGSAKFLQIPCSSTRWEDDSTIPVPEDANSTILIPLIAIRLQWDYVDQPPLVRLKNLMGRVNDSDFLGCGPETLLFENFDVTETFKADPASPHTNRVTVQMTLRQIEDTPRCGAGSSGSGSPSVDVGGQIIGWNHDYREHPAGWYRLLLSNGSPRYRLKSFAGMFQ